MVSLRRGTVVRMVSEREGIQVLEVELADETRQAVCFPPMTGACSVNDEVLLNTTAVELGLGTGGRHFVVANLTRPEHSSPGPGHVMKLRYTPLQVRVRAGGEAESLQEALGDDASLNSRPVIVLPLHSMLAPAAVAFAETTSPAPLTYLMTDSAALPIALSDTVAALRERGLIAGTVTCGHAFGGSVEAVGLYDGLLLAAETAPDGAVVVAPGPGIVGTGTRFGTTALEQGQVINAAAALGGRIVVAPRLSLADERPRHRGISHHTVTALTVAALVPAVVAFPAGYPDVFAAAVAELTRKRNDGRAGLTEEHLVTVDATPVCDRLRSYDLWPKSMGRTPDDDPVLFEAAAAAGIVAGRMVGGRGT